MADYRKQLETKTAETIKKFSEQYKARTSELTALRQGLERRQKDVEELRRHDAERHGAEFAALQQTHEDNVDAVRRELTAEAAAAMQTAISDAASGVAAKAAAQLTAEREGSGAKLEQVTKELVAMRNAEKVGRAMAEKARAALAESHAAAERALKAQLAALQEQVQSGTTTMGDELKNALMQLTEQTAKVVELEQQLNVAKRRGDAAEAVAQDADQKSKAAEKEAMELRAELLAAHAAAKLVAADHASQMAAKDEELKGIVDFCNGDRDALDQRMADMEDELEKANDALRLAQDGAQGSLDASCKQFDAERKQLKMEAAGATAEVVVIQKKMKLIADTVRKEWDEDRARIVAAHAAELRGVVASGSQATGAEIEQVRKEAEGALAALRTQLTEVELACAKAESIATTLRKKLATITKTEEAHLLEITRLTTDLKGSATRIKTLETDVRNHEVEESRLANTHTKLEDQLAALEAEMKVLRASAARDAQEVADARLVAEDATNLHSEASDAAVELARTHAAETARKVKETAAKRKQLEDRIDELNTEVVEIRAAHSKALTDLKLADSLSSERHGSLEAAKMELEALHSARLDELMDEHSNKVSALQSDLAELKTAHKAAMDVLTRKQLGDVDALTAAHDDAVAALAYANKKALTEAAEELKQAAERVRAECVDELNDERKRLESLHASQLSKQAHSYKEGLERKVGAALAEEKAAFTDQLAAKQRELEHAMLSGMNAGDTTAALEEKLATAEQEMDDLGQDLTAMKAELNRKVAELVQLQNDMNSKMTDQEESLKVEHQAKIETLINGYRDQFGKAKEEAIAQRTALEKKVLIFTEELGHAQERFNLRPAREEDTAKISELEIQVAALQRRATKLQSETDRYRLEVQHQDKAFSQVFASGKSKGINNMSSKQHPSVGTSSPSVGRRSTSKVAPSRR
jgi:chromosome segregation ATPase